MESVIPSDNGIRALRARHREIRFRNFENKDKAKVKGEGYDHVEGFFVKDVEKTNRGILSYGDRVLNMDVTSVSFAFGKRIQVFGSSQTHNGCFGHHQLEVDLGRM